MSAALRQLAEAVGLMLEWSDSDGQSCTLPENRQRKMLALLGWPAADEAQVRDSLARWQARQRPEKLEGLPPLLIADQGVAFTVPSAAAAERAFSLRLETGETYEGHLDEHGRLPPIETLGYHRLSLLGASADDTVCLTLAVTPPRCFSIADISAGEAPHDGSLWGTSVQLYALPREGDGGIGDLLALDTLCQRLAPEDVDAVAISPLHALFGAHPERFSPYSPSSRLFYNVWHAAPECVFDAETVARARAPFAEAMALQAQQALIDWPASVKLKLDMLERLFLHVQRDERALAWRSRFIAFRRDGGESLERHCRFEVLLAQSKTPDWRRWPAAWHDPNGAEVEAFAERHREAITFAAFLQWLVAAGLAHVQQRAIAAGMRLGLIADLAVGIDPSGSQAWSYPGELLTSCGVGAPPDAFNARGQSWGVAAFSPQGLVASGYHGFLAMLRAGFAHAGGLRIDHILGFSRLWLIPEGESAEQGAYVRYPLEAMLRLVALESWRHRAIVIGEDLGTVEAGLRERLAAYGVLGMSVLWFERDGDDFLPGARWRHDTLATTSTHDLPTVAGWWQGEDLRWRERLKLFKPGETMAESSEQRRFDRQRLAARLELDAIADDDGIAAAAIDVEDVVDAALLHVASTPTPLALLPLEDLLGLTEQANLPGTTDEHPNWRRRLPQSLSVALDDPPLKRRLKRIAHLRRRLEP
ncbi:4-alpha-glucanotransferase [Salinicola rhizosphaerae]|uniref:4-alpha-glucanotransferase n=1 Tax=Salinicola rhizosphaerae TaxID=1443141 RepID=A0ABQ3DUM0_9GAMM|nr:4-alpha-glucanotransferase [Salinicola rhizosphaerae]GHB15926.1 4-alpha-glucanotransferase [Salinicola rhizosphaerae]